MARKRSELICPECGKRCFKRTNPVAFVHYDHTTKRRKTCYPKGPRSPADPPKESWGESKVYYKLGNMANHFRRIADQLEGIQEQVFKFKPNDDISAQAAEDLDLFDKKFLNVVEKILVPLYDKRWTSTNWPGWFKIQMDSLFHGPRAAGSINAPPIEKKNKFKLSEDAQTVHITPTLVKCRLSTLQVKKNNPKSWAFAKELIESHPLFVALDRIFSFPDTEKREGVSVEELLRFRDNEIKRRSKRQ